uniref:Reverse transcriptase domain-containing protein n=1 Tax=Tanacetum cinerariifolium TaxID=118510 RepID=A0A6L2LRG5_TANCI|nr:reverse transcriptase domain-containing protein [Tanacetum cinerariifolium]
MAFMAFSDLELAILDENISQEDLNMKFLKSFSAEWNTHVVVWRNKPDLETMSFDDLYNNFKIVKQEVKRMITSSSSSGSQNMAFLSTPGSINDVDTATIQVSTVSTPFSTLALLSMRARRSPRSQERRPRNQDSSRKTVIMEDKSYKAMVAIDGAGFDWSYMADDEVPTNMAFMAFSDLEAYENSLIYKERTKKLHDVKIKNRIFNVGNQVLLFNSRLKVFSGLSPMVEAFLCWICVQFPRPSYLLIELVWGSPYP